MRCLLALLVMCAFASPAAAEFPDRPIHLVVPQAAGSATDTLARIFGAAFSDALGQTVIVDDRPGGALTVGMDVVAKAPPDGYTLGMAPIGALALTSHLVEPLPYNVERDFAPIVIVTRGQLLLAVSPTTEIHSVKQLIDFAKANPGKLYNASSSNGSPGHVDGELFKYLTGTSIVHVPYKGGAAAISDLMAGRVQVMFESLNSIVPFANRPVRPPVSPARPLARFPRSADRRRSRRRGLCRADLDRRHRARWYAELIIDKLKRRGE